MRSYCATGRSAPAHGNRKIRPSDHASLRIDSAIDELATVDTRLVFYVTDGHVFGNTFQWHCGAQNALRLALDRAFASNSGHVLRSIASVSRRWFMASAPTGVQRQRLGTQRGGSQLAGSRLLEQGCTNDGGIAIAELALDDGQ